MCEVEVQVGDGAVKPREVVPRVTEKSKDELDKIVEELSVPTTLEGMVEEVQDTQGLVGAYETERALEARKVNYAVCGRGTCANSVKRIALDEKAKYCGMCGHETRIIASAPENAVTVERIVEKEVPVYLDSTRRELSKSERYKENCRLIREGKIPVGSPLAHALAVRLFDDLKTIFPEYIFKIPQKIRTNECAIVRSNKTERVTKNRLFRSPVEITRKLKKTVLEISAYDSSTDSSVTLDIYDQEVLPIAERIYDEFKRDCKITTERFELRYHPTAKS